MELGMSLNALLHPPLSSSSSTFNKSSSSFNQSLFSIPKQIPTRTQQHRHVLVVEAKGKKGMASRQFQRPPPPPLPKVEDDGNPKFVVFIRMANVNLWYPLSIVSGGTTAKIMIAAKDNFLGKYIYKDTLDRNLAAVIYRDEKEIQTTAFKQHPVLKSASEFRYGYKLIVNGNVKAALSSSNVIQLPTPDKLKTVVDQVKDFFEDVKDTFRQITSLDATDDTEESKKETKQKSKVKG
ncbi:protein HHL1, chloroplastic-like [Vicia villosa]|uniref:protein HHL1, chloroplastic-like n=1 Tax=Vicia villosa TaxID=3911 RepID=UPI00273CA69E|nr:protein HHL1, chloroplastic-like [Vicia villosa]